LVAEDILLEVIVKDGTGPDILCSEFKKALQELKNRKADGTDGIAAVLLKADKPRNLLLVLFYSVSQKKSPP